MSRLAIFAALLFSTVAAADVMQNLASPGPLAAPHKELDTQCDKCHVPFKGIPSSACLACHTATRARIESGTGTHAQWDKQGRKCSSCHGDHKGRA
ncbi:MAG TPA: cytochrome c family protein, partial [Polyangia bacterium]|nr:cytochrome c family protein [Polyangia bacterium]